MFHQVELAQHEVDIDEDDAKTEDKVIDVTPNGAGRDIAEAVGHIHLVRIGPVLGSSISPQLSRTEARSPWSLAAPGRAMFSLTLVELVTQVRTSDMK